MNKIFTSIKFVIIIVFLSLSIGTQAQRNNTFQHSYGGNLDDFGGSVLVLPDNGYIITGFTKSFGAGGYDIIVIRTDSLGQTKWAKTFGGSSDEGNVAFYVYPSMDVTLSTDNNIVICSNTESFGKGGKDVYVLKLDLSGNIVWTKTYGGTADDIGYGITNAPGGGFLIVGQTLSFGAGNGDVLLMKTDNNGNLVWSNTYGNSTSEEAGYSIIPCLGGNFLICGYSNNSPNAYDQLVMKVDGSGKLLWSKVYGGSSYDMANNIMELPDKSIYMDGYAYDNNLGAGVGALTKLDSTGNLKWTKEYLSGFRTMVYNSKKNVFNAIGLGGFGGNSSRIFMAGFDTSGNVHSLNSYGPASTSNGGTFGQGHLMQSLSNGGFILLGCESMYGAGLNDIFLVKTDANGNTNSCNTVSGLLSASQFAFSDHSYSFSTTSITPSVSSGGSTSEASLSDSAVCHPFVANFGYQTNASHMDINFSDSTYYKPINWNWNFGDPTSTSNTSAQKNPVHTYRSAGTYKVKLVAGDGSITDSIVKTIIVNEAGINNNTMNNIDAHIYPNPVKDNLAIKIDGAQIQLITITNIIGQTVCSYKLNAAAEKEIDTRNLTNGIYILNIQTNKGNINTRFIKE